MAHFNNTAFDGQFPLATMTFKDDCFPGLVCYFLDLKTLKFIEKTIMTPFGMGCSLPEEVNETVVFSDRRMETAFLKEADGIHITVNCNNFSGVPMKADLKIAYPEEYETLNVVIPWSENKFQFTAKHQGLAAEGMLESEKANMNSLLEIVSAAWISEEGYGLTRPCGIGQMPPVWVTANQ